LKKFVFIAAFFMTFMFFSASTSATQVLFVANCNQSITLRESPSVSANEITQIPLGQGVAIIDEADNGFYRVSYGKYSGYVLADYLSDKAPDNLKVGMLVQKATLFESPSTHSEKIMSIISGHWVWYIGDGYFSRADSPDFYLIQAPNGTYGYILADRVDWNYRGRNQ
jgi:uncharacterized protein YgiM (DUF1202 family)